MKNINRRKFLGDMGIGVAGTLGSKITTSYGKNVKNTNVLRLAEEENINPLDVKLNVKPVYLALIHSGMWLGPCRWDAQQTPEEERVTQRKRFENILLEDKRNLSKDVKLLEPVYYEYSEDLDSIGEDLFSKLDKDKDKVDFYAVNGNVFRQYPGALIGERYKKPLAMTGDLISTECAAYLRSKGLEGYAYLNYDDLNDLISILRARKVFQQTNILSVTNRGRKLNRPVSSVSDFEDLKERFGIDTQIANYKELSDEMNRVKQSKDTMEKVVNFADNLIKNARAVHLDRKYVINSIEYHFAVKNLMKKYNSNAYGIECREFCASRLPEKWKIVTCLTHTLLKDEGLSSACEGDISALLAMRVLMSLSHKSALMGNMYYRAKNVIRFGHEVTAMKMNGFDKPDLPYELRNFIYTGWGTKAQVDLTRIREKTVTLARFNPLATKILVTKGEAIGLEGFGRPGCAIGVPINIPDARELCDRRVNYGFHFGLVYGDYTRELGELGKMLKVDIEYHNV